ncbi:MAG: aldo/keto reductase [Candidatus Poribacteria bacterium]|nr:aldo/keto reductase [Candidatus Poribacteria bacterium]
MTTSAENQKSQVAEGLPTATLGRTGLEVTRLGYGAMEIRTEFAGNENRPLSEDQAETILNAVLDSGINYIDTADCYGRSEEFIGRFISHRRDEYYLATKCGCHPDHGQKHKGWVGKIWTKENIHRGVDESLRRLKTDYIDVMQFHGATVEDCEKGNVIEALQEAQAQGKLRWIGTSSALEHKPTFLQWGSFDVFQLGYSALDRTAEDFITEAAEAGTGTVIRGGVAQGEPGEGRGNSDNWQKAFDAAKLDELREEGESRTGFVLRFTLSHPHVHTTIVGTRNPDHLRENARTAQRGALAPDVYAEAKRRLDAVGLKPAELV